MVAFIIDFFGGNVKRGISSQTWCLSLPRSTMKRKQGVSGDSHPSESLYRGLVINHWFELSQKEIAGSYENKRIAQSAFGRILKKKLLF